jgi:hypothetical protein
VFPDAEKADLISVLNKQIIILDYRALPSTITAGKEFVVILADLNGKRVSVNSGEIVLKQLSEIKDKLPIKATITKQKGKRYYTLT